MKKLAKNLTRLHVQQFFHHCGPRQKLLATTLVYILAPSLSFASLSFPPCRVDMTRYPELSKIPWYQAVLNAGDCLYLPYQWIHHAIVSLLIRTPSGPAILSFVERLSSLRGDFL